MIQRSLLLLLLAPWGLCLFTLSGCQVNDAWKSRMNRHERLAAADDDAFFKRRRVTGDVARDDSGIHPGHSSDADEFNENYAPYDAEPRDAGRRSVAPASPRPNEPGRLVPLIPPLVPPSRAATSQAKPEQPVTEQDVRLPTHQLIKTLRSPWLFRPERVRSMYDRLRGQDAEQPAASKPSGPIAQFPFRERAARACVYSEVDAVAACPVTLGLPETDSDPVRDQSESLTGSFAGYQSRLPAAMQATPSSFKHPLLADPTGVPYPSP